MYNRGLKQDDWTLAEHTIVEFTPDKGTSVMANSRLGRKSKMNPKY